MLTDDASRGRLLTESSTRAFSGLRTRAMETLARIRAIALAAFGLVAVTVSVAGDPEARAELWPLLGYALSGYLLLRWRRGGGSREHVTMGSPIVDVPFMFLLVWAICPRADGQGFK